ncbi:MAG TPA: alpha/beta fold hydrolase [Gemmatimonadales bacterium]|nr:alpha/beta fold hydrolase [Gemmatimonadales bacterium]
MWRHQATAFADRRCIAPDLRGAGTAPAPDAASEYSMRIYAEGVMALLDGEDVKRAVFCGLSMGGYIMFELVRRFPDRIAALVLCNTKATADSAEAKLGRDALAATARQRGARTVANEMVPKLLAAETRASQSDVVREVTEMIARQPVSGIVGALRALRDRPDSTATLAEIRVPALVVAGDDDQIAPADGMKAMAGRIAGARFEMIRSAGHLTPLEQPHAFNAVLRTFLAMLD